MLSWIKGVLRHLRPGKKGSSVRFSSGEGEELSLEDKDLNVLKTEESYNTNNTNRFLLSTSHSSSTSPLPPPPPHSLKATPAAPPPPLSNQFLEFPAAGPSNVHPQLVEWEQSLTPSSKQLVSSVTLQETLKKPPASWTYDTSSPTETWMPLGSQQGTPAAAASFSVERDNQSETDRQTAGSEVLGLTIKNLQPRCFLAATVTNRSGKLVTVQDERYVLVESKGEKLIVPLSAGPCDFPPCRVVWRARRPVPLVELPDETCVMIDAIVSPESGRLHAVVVWQDSKPDICVQLLDRTYTFLDSRGLVCRRESLDIVAKKLSALYDGTSVSAEVCDAVVFIGPLKATMVELLQLGFDEFYATVFKMLEGTDNGRVLYVCTCLWVGQRPPMDRLPMIIERHQLYFKLSHGLYSKSKKTHTLYIDVDASLNISSTSAALQMELDGSRMSLEATHLLSFQPGSLEVGSVARVAVHVSKKCNNKMVTWSPVMIKLIDSMGQDAAPNWLVAGCFTPNAASHYLLASEDWLAQASKGCVPVKQNASVTTAQKAQKTSLPANQVNDIPPEHDGVPAAQKVNTPPALKGSVEAGQNACVSGAQRANVPIPQKASTAAAQKASAPAAQKASAPAAQKASAPAAQKASAAAAQKASAAAAQKASAAAAQKASAAAAQKASAAAAQKASAAAVQKASGAAAQKASGAAAQKASAAAAQKASAAAAQKASAAAAQKASASAAQKASASPVQKASAAPAHKDSIAVAQKDSAPTRKSRRKKKQKSASLSQLQCQSWLEPDNASSPKVQSEYLTCRVLAAGPSTAVVMGDGKKILVAKGDLFVDEAPLPISANVALSVKKFPNLGVIFTQSQDQHHIHGHTVDLEALAAWGGKKPSIINTIVQQRLSKMKGAAVPKVTPTPPAALFAAETIIDATCIIKTVVQQHVSLVARSKLLPGGCGMAHARLCDIYENGTPVTQTRAEKIKDKTFHCRLSIEDGGKRLTVPLAWCGKKPVTDALSRSTATQPFRALSTSDLSSISHRPLLGQQGDRPLPLQSPPKQVLVGEVIETLLDGGRLKGEDGQYYYYSSEVCFLFGVCLHQVEPRQVLIVGMKVEFEVAESSTNSVDEASVQRVWVGGHDAALAFSSLGATLDSWCSHNGVSITTQQTLKEAAELLSPSLFPTAAKVEATNIIDITA